MRSNIEGAEIRNCLIWEKNRLGQLKQAITAEFVMDADMPHLIILDPSGAGKDVLLPPEALGLWFVIANSEDVSGDLAVKEDSDTTTIVTIPPDGAYMVFSDGVAWYVSPNPVAASATNLSLSGTLDVTGQTTVDDIIYGTLNDGTDDIGASAAEINMAADSSANTEIVTTTNVITAAESGKTFILNSATAFVSTLPAVAAGLRFTFIAGATQVTGGNHTIVPNGANDNTIYGELVVNGASVPGSAEGSINWIADTMLPGDRVDLFCDGTNWYVQGTASASGAITLTT